MILTQPDIIQMQEVMVDVNNRDTIGGTFDRETILAISRLDFSHESFCLDQ